MLNENLNSAFLQKKTLNKQNEMIKKQKNTDFFTFEGDLHNKEQFLEFKFEKANHKEQPDCIFSGNILEEHNTFNTLENILKTKELEKTEVNTERNDNINFWNSNEYKGCLDKNKPEDEEYFLKTKDRLLPLANVSKIMKSSVPETGKIAKDAKSTLQHSASEFIAIVTCRAKDIAAIESRKVVTGDDLIKAMNDLDLNYFSEIANKYFTQYKKTTNSYASLYLDQNSEL
ncbi:NFYB4 [Ecytonucleospora hepatopenaei]|uniref:NFYB4 n=1 Tax=Ecytonucleospora hepatopenaei TaxID=646526 RepID=A0A1W0E5I0_9MICR|nr:NFYB4 [Ecytonucleospora hepatopenaei]